MKDFEFYLKNVGEIGFVEQNLGSVFFVSGLPNIRPNELVITETGALGQVFSLNREFAEILLFSNLDVSVGEKVVRTDSVLEIPVGDSLLGRVIDPLGGVLDGGPAIVHDKLFSIDRPPPKISERKIPDSPFGTGVPIVDIVTPLARGQRELVIGDRKTGKTEFLLQVVLSQAAKGTICIYAVIGQKYSDIINLGEFFKAKNIFNQTILIASSSSEKPGIIYLTPYTAMTIAEYFCDKGIDVLLILDDMTTHARVYREISLLSRRFPGRSSYPGDIFNLHARLVERAGSFKKGAITLLPVSESILGDLTGYIQTNLMAMTDGHIFFDINLYNEGKRPAVNPFLSVTRVGHQVQKGIVKDMSREVTSFLVTYDRMKQFLHFGAEIGQNARSVLSLGSKLDVFLYQSGFVNIDVDLNVLIVAGLWAGIWDEVDEANLKASMERVILSFNTDDNYRKEVKEAISRQGSFAELVAFLRRQKEIISSKM
jgi:F-type H+-transporting ATPase subunit alpha